MRRRLTCCADSTCSQLGLSPFLFRSIVLWVVTSSETLRDANIENVSGAVFLIHSVREEAVLS